jgi:hypothetical protein
MGTKKDRMFFQIEKIEDLAKNVVHPPVVWIWGIQKLLDFFYINDVSLNVRLPRVRGLEKEKQNGHTMVEFGQTLRRVAKSGVECD